MNWILEDLKIGDYIKCQSSTERYELQDTLDAYGYKTNMCDFCEGESGYWLIYVARYYDTKNLKVAL